MPATRVKKLSFLKAYIPQLAAGPHMAQMVGTTVSPFLRADSSASANEKVFMDVGFGIVVLEENSSISPDDNIS